MAKLETAFGRFDEYNKNAPESITWDGKQFPSEYFYALKLYEWVIKLDGNASEALLLASRSQHIGRWEIARKTYPDGRAGYLKWRSDLSRFHAAKAGEILQSVGYDQEMTERVGEIIRKSKLKTDPDVQTMENALCLVFLEFQFDELIEKLSEEKMIDILRKTWAKMSEPGREAALSLQFSEEGTALINKALS
ncbi:DUF4202 domain-containing protein [Dyadobacter psychrotolerans]|uniref:DUF4202 domain-containing protein n=1 Tax=Dyadobacter psychrotolerans TaxID=2541721 RepID=A0A4R5D9K1_9BACT|nr:DUF4202 domain-containing protein [Dyadobacter psychrotolerans]TDE10246.1 DUF4202 domain-containing protein [Dyadobacter psychrotolerans]